MGFRKKLLNAPLDIDNISFDFNFPVSLTTIPYAYGLSIEPTSGRCVNFGSDQHGVGTAYNFLAVSLYSVLPIVITTVLSVRMMGHFASDDRQSLVSRKNVNR